MLLLHPNFAVIRRYNNSDRYALVVALLARAFEGRSGLVRSWPVRLGSLNREQGISMLVVEQNASLALGIANRGYVLETGSIVAAGDAAELETNDDVRRAYLGI